MAVGLVGGAMLGAVFGELLGTIDRQAIRCIKFKSLFRQLKSTLDLLNPIFQDIEALDRVLVQIPNETRMLKEKLEQGRELVWKCAGVRCWNIPCRVARAKELIEFDNSLVRFLQTVPLLNLRSVLRADYRNSGPSNTYYQPTSNFVAGGVGTGAPAYQNFPYSGPSNTYYQSASNFVAGGVGTGAAAGAPISGVPYPSSFNSFPQEAVPAGGAGAGFGTLDYLRNNQQFQVLRSRVQSNPRTLQFYLQELGRQNPQGYTFIQEHYDEFLRLINEPMDGSEGGIGTGAAAGAPISGVPNPSFFNSFPQEAVAAGGAGAGLGPLDYLRYNRQFQDFRSIVQSNPQTLQPLLQELGRQNPQGLRLIQEHQAEFLHLINEPVDASEGYLFYQP